MSDEGMNGGQFQPCGVPIELRPIELRPIELRPIELRPIRRRFLLLLLVFPAFLLALMAAQVRAQSTSPGPLASSHKKWDNQCKKCHVAGKGVRDERCLDCHKEAKKSRYHWKMAQDAGKSCAKCHREHRGRGFRMIRWRPAKNFDHGLTGWRLEGRHLKLRCNLCHKKPQRWMGLGNACVNCHKNPHVPSLGKSCAKCHSQQRFAPAPRFSHDRARFRLRGRHREVQCAKCHNRAGAKGQYRGLSFSSCASCHSDPVKGHSRGEACESCHTEQSWRRVRKGAGLQLHSLTKFRLRDRHRSVRCVKCHRSRRTLPKTPILRLRAFEGLSGACVSCHRDPHGKRFGTRCQDCHKTVSWLAKPSGVRFKHGRTGFPLRGKHRGVRCAACHKPSKSYKKQYKQIPHERCADCHSDVHAGDFATVKDSMRCEHCHTESSFKAVKFGFETHGRARFKLVGAHRVVACQDCHVPGKASTKRGRHPKHHRSRVHARSPKHVARLVGTPQTCTACHKDPHGGQFDGRKPALQCTSCHTATSFRPASGFDHKNTDFKLDGVHSTAKCSACHRRERTKSPVQFAGVGTACVDCHRDQHGGQFAGGGPQGGPKRDCTSCHTPVKGFRIKNFDHNSTRFPLAGQHERVACARCHRKVRVGGVEVKHYRLGTLTCDRCHQNPHARGGR